MRRSVLRRGVCAAAVVGLTFGMVAACGSSSKSNAAPSSSASSSGAASSSAAPTGSPIKIGIIASLSGSQASSSNQGATVGPAWAEWVNANGGINGHPVQLTIKDDRGDPTTAQSVGKDLISAGVQVVLAGSDNLLPAFDNDMIAAKIPVVGGPTNSPDWYSKAGLFALNTDNVSGLNGQVAVAKQFGHATKFANLYCSEVAACGKAGAVLKAAAAKAGIGYYEAAVSSTAASYTSQCLSLEQQKVDYVQLNFASAAAAKFIQDCQAQNYNPTWGQGDQAYGSAIAALKNFTLFGPAYTFVPVAGGAAQNFVDAMKKYAKDDNWHYGTAAYDWAGLVAIQKALANVSPTATVTAADVMNGFYAFKGENLGGLLANKVTFTPGKPNAYGGQPCYFVYKVKDGTETAPNGLNPVCPTAS